MAKTAEQMKENDDRTTSMGLFNFAEAYRLSAIKLQASPVKAGHAESPMRFLWRPEETADDF
jgi:hypothetical protein